jgi:hypothetical protein
MLHPRRLASTGWRRGGPCRPARTASRWVGRQTRAIGRTKGRSGLRPETRQGALPPGPPPLGSSARGQAPAEPLGSIHCVSGAGGGTGAGLGGRHRTGDRPARWRPPRPAPVPPPAPQTQVKGSKACHRALDPVVRCPWRGSKGQRPLVGSRGEALVVLWFTRSPCGPGACAVAGSSSAGAPRGWAARPGWRRQPPFHHRPHVPLG